MKTDVEKNFKSMCFVMKQKEFVNFINDVNNAFYHANLHEKTYKKTTWNILATMTEIEMDIEDQNK